VNQIKIISKIRSNKNVNNSRCMIEIMTAGSMQTRRSITRAFHVDFGYSLFCRCTPKQHEERALAAFQRLFRAEFSFKE